jgi:methyltransferase (TIGR00027 family)
MLPGTYEWVVARTFFLDEQFRGALDEKYDQIINLGAGFDSRPYRYVDIIRDTVIFELDLPEPQKIKRELLEKRGVLTPDNLRYVPIDFNTDDLLQKLKDAGFQEDKRNLFIWEGVTEYLSEKATDSTLAFIKNYSGQGTRIAFTYIYRSAVEGRKTFYGSKEIVNRVAKNGEPYRYGIEEDEIESFLTERGYNLVSHHTAEDLEKKYLTASDGKLFGRICGHNNIVVAETILE